MRGRVLVAAHRLLRGLLLGALVVVLLLGLVAGVAGESIRVENYATASDQPGATALVPEPGKLYLRMEARHPYLAPLPADVGQGEAKWCVAVDVRLGRSLNCCA